MILNLSIDKRIIQHKKLRGCIPSILEIILCKMYIRLPRCPYSNLIPLVKSNPIFFFFFFNEVYS